MRNLQHKPAQRNALGRTRSAMTLTGIGSYGDLEEAANTG